MEVELNEQSRHMIMLNLVGDVSLTWDADQDANMRVYIEKKMKEGYSFFILEKNWLGMSRKKKVVDINDIGANKKVWMDDEELENAFKSGKIKLLKNTNNQYTTTRLAKTADEVVENPTVATRPMKGG